MFPPQVRLGWTDVPDCVGRSMHITTTTRIQRVGATHVDTSKQRVGDRTPPTVTSCTPFMQRIPPAAPLRTTRIQKKNDGERDKMTPKMTDFLDDHDAHLKSSSD
jgi:hypothetical protein